MKNHPRSIVLASALAVVGGLFVTGCQSSKSPALTQGAATSASVDSAATAVLAAEKQIDVALAALTSLVETPQDIPVQYKTALAEFQKLVDGQKKVEDASSGMRAKGDAYLADWGRQVAKITDPALRDAAFARRADVSAKLQGIFQSYQQTKVAYDPFKKHLGDIKQVLGADLSAMGLEAVKPSLAKATADAVPLKAALAKLAADFSAFSASIQPGGK